jgi:uncharacterized protein
MTTLDRRAFLRGAVIATGGIAVGGSFRGVVGSAKAAPPEPGLSAVPDLRDGTVRLHLPRGFQYRSFHDTEFPETLDDGTSLPGRSDGMGAFPGPDGNVWLVRNHEINGPGAPFGPGTPYDTQARAGTTTVLTTPFGEVVGAFTSLNGTQMNCAGAVTPWGSWIACEETVNGPDVGPDFTGVSNVTLQQRHGFIYDVPAGGQSNREPITAAGRFAHEAAAFDPGEGILYLTEDNFGWPSGLYRYLPATNPVDVGSLVNEGQLQMLRVVGQPNANLAAEQTNGATYPVDWVDIADPAPTFPYTPGQTAPTTNDTALTYVGKPGPGPGRGLLLAPRGRHFCPQAGVLRCHSGGRAGRNEPRADCRRLREWQRPGVVVRHQGPDSDLQVPVPGPGRPRFSRQHHGPQQRRDDRHLRGQRQRQLRARAHAGGSALRHRPQSTGQPDRDLAIQRRVRRRNL